MTHVPENCEHAGEWATLQKTPTLILTNWAGQSCLFSALQLPVPLPGPLVQQLPPPTPGQKRNSKPQQRKLAAGLKHHLTNTFKCDLNMFENIKMLS